MAFAPLVLRPALAVPSRHSALPRAHWDGLMDWMVEKHGMHPLDGALRTIILDDLAQHFGPRESLSSGSPLLN